MLQAGGHALSFEANTALMCHTVSLWELSEGWTCWNIYHLLVTYFPVSMLEREGQHMGVVTKAFVNDVPPSSRMRRDLFMACMEPTEECTND